MKSQSGWSLVETLVVTALMGLLAAIVAWLFSSIMRSAREEMSRSQAQSVLMLSLARLERSLQRSCHRGISYRPGPPAILAIHPQPEGAVPRVPLWEPFWVTFLWHEQRLLTRQSPPYPALIPAPTDRPKALDETNLATLVADPIQRARPLADHVSWFHIGLSNSASLDIELEIEFLPPGRVSTEKLRVRRRLFLRNNS